jgi:hypothetical protein
MKIVKIDKRYKVSDRGFKIALRFDSYSNEVGNIERWCRDNIGQQSWEYSFQDSGQLTGYFGRSQKKNEPRPYYVAFKNEAYVSTILLLGDIDK